MCDYNIVILVCLPAQLACWNLGFCQTQLSPSSHNLLIRLDFFLLYNNQKYDILCDKKYLKFKMSGDSASFKCIWKQKSFRIIKHFTIRREQRGTLLDNSSKLVSNYIPRCNFSMTLIPTLNFGKGVPSPNVALTFIATTERSMGCHEAHLPPPPVQDQLMVKLSKHYQ